MATPTTRSRRSSTPPTAPDGSGLAHAKESPRNLRLVGNRSSQLPVSPSGSVAPSNLRGVATGDRAAGGQPSPCGDAHPPSPPASRLAAIFRRRSPHPARLAALQTGPPIACLAARPACGFPSGLAALGSPRSRSPFRSLGRSPGSLASIASTAWSEANSTGGPRGGQLRVPAGQGTYPQVRGSEQRVTKRRTAREPSITPAQGRSSSVQATSSRYTASISAAEVSHVNRRAWCAASVPRERWSVGSRRIRSSASA